MGFSDPHQTALWILVGGELEDFLRGTDTPHMVPVLGLRMPVSGHAPKSGLGNP